jgi:hypothetical protein
MPGRQITELALCVIKRGACTKVKSKLNNRHKFPNVHYYKIFKPFFALELSFGDNFPSLNFHMFLNAALLFILLMIFACESGSAIERFRNWVTRILQRVCHGFEISLPRPTCIPATGFHLFRNAHAMISQCTCQGARSCIAVVSARRG